MKSMFINKYGLILVIIFYFFSNVQVFAQGKSPYISGNSYPVMHVVEVSFTSQAQYNSNFSAYLDVDVWVNLTGPGGTYKIPVFWDGGNVFRARLVATSTGTWNWSIDESSVTNSDQGFIGNNVKSGSFNATPAGNTSANPNNHGFIRVAANNRTLEYADGAPFFYTADTSWSALTAVFGFNQANTITDISFQDYILARKNQGFNGLNVIASFPDDTYLDELGRNRDQPGTESGLWSNATDRMKVGPNGETPFEMKAPPESFTHWNDEVNYKKINPTYWQSVDERMQFLADQGFVTLFETIRRHERWPFRTQQSEKDAFYNYVRYLWARYGCYNMIFSWVHHDTNAFNVYPQWRDELVKPAHLKLSARLGNRMPYGQPRTAMSFNTSLNNWERDIPDALDIQNVSNAERDEDMHRWLADIYYYRPDQPNQPTTVKPALNLEPFYPGWGLHSNNEINNGLNDATMAQMQMYGSVLSGGLAGHAWGDVWYAGAASSTSNRIVREDNPQVNALGAFVSEITGQTTNFESQAMGHLKSFILDAGHEYERLIPAAESNLNNNQNYVQTLSISDDKAFALGFLTTSYSIPTLTNLLTSEPYRFEWWDVTNGGWTNAGDLTTTSGGQLTIPNRPDNTKNWAYRIRSLDYINGNPTPNSTAIRINTGGTGVNYNGDNYLPDNHYDTGTSLDRPETGLPEPFQSIRYSSSEVMSYDIPLDNGDYTVHLHFAEIWFGATGGGSGGTGSRIFDVSIEGQLAEDNLDVFAEVGAETLLTRTHTVSITDGVLNIDFDSRNAVGGERHPIINAIEILEIEAGDPPIANAGSDQTTTLPNNSLQLTGSGSDPDGGNITYSWSQNSGPSTATITGATSATPTISNLQEGSYIFELIVTDDETETTSDTVTISVNPEPNTNSFALRINTGGAVTTYNGNNYMADNYFDTGSTLDRPQTGLPAPMKSIRYSTSEIMGYDIPLSNGDYTVNLHFAEIWFGATGGGSGGIGSRVFDVNLESTLVEDNLDVFAQVGAEAVLTKSYTVTITDGQLNIDFDSRTAVGGNRHPIINAIEILGIEDNGTAGDLVGHWPLDEQNGAIASDMSGEDNDGTLVNGVNFTNDSTNGQIGDALSFDGFNDHITLPNIDDGMQTGFSVSAWINPSNTNGYQGITGTNSSQGFMTFVHNGKLGFALKTNTGRKLMSHGTIVASQWQHIAVTYDGNTMSWFVNGLPVGTLNHTGTLLDQNTGYIGYSGYAQEYFNGKLDDVRIFESALSNNQINDIYSESLTPLPDSVGYWPFDEQNGTTANDISGEGNDGLLINGFNFNNNSANGQIAGALTFDGLDDQINLPDIDNDLNEGFSLSAWINPTNTNGYHAIAGTDTSSGFMTFVHNGKLTFVLRTDTGREIKDFGSIVSNQWQHIAVTYDGSTMSWYIDGILVGTHAHDGQVSDRSNGYIGWSGYSNEFFEGIIDEVKLYNDELSQTQVSVLYNESNTTSSNLKARIWQTSIINNGYLSAFVHPNPTTGKFRITGIPIGDKEIIVTDFSNRVIITLKTDEHEPEIDLSIYPKGIYIIKSLQNKSEQILKVIKE
ncbi:DUF4038 domain-containing protein [Aurantibacter crassamenti]|uniref:malectin domain-containing carbohydrate-binding protein n=1 Tax=Aurantibacter crassamenti TaxID=1837375 RepID=UPI00193A6BF5|nr:malectin domain-containing carbohydrate-binding protein [Aurantibacter crassamenti]MBM1105637.1 DUF4038 domain-containing protein [Aurantibacter crassamenti]